MVAPRRHPWSNAPSDAEPKDDTPRRHFIPSKEKIREWAKASHEGGRFQCPSCKEYFSMTYARFGAMRMFENPTNYCKDCSDPKTHPEFRKATR